METHLNLGLFHLPLYMMSQSKKWQLFSFIADLSSNLVTSKEGKNLV